jgi:transcription-repair coupling factor
MSQSDILSLWSVDLTKKATLLASKDRQIVVSGLANETGRAICSANFLRASLGKSALILVNDVKQRSLMVNHLSSVTAFNVEEFALEVNASNDKFIARENLILKTNLAAKLSRDNFGFVVATYDDALANVAKQKDVFKSLTEFKVGDRVNMVEIFEKLISMNYFNGQSVQVDNGEYYCMGDQLTIYPANFDYPVRISVEFDEIEKIEILDRETRLSLSEVESFVVWPILDSDENGLLSEYAIEDILIIEDEIDLYDEHFKLYEKFLSKTQAQKIRFSTFNEDEPNHAHCMFSSTLRYSTLYDFISDLNLKKQNNWQILLLTQKKEQIEKIFNEHHFKFIQDGLGFIKGNSGVFIKSVDSRKDLLSSVQDIEQKILIISDREVPGLDDKQKKNKNNHQVYLDLLTSLKVDDLVVHSEHGIGRFEGLASRQIDDINKEFMQIAYAQNDKLFVPIDQADRISKYIGAAELAPKLTRLGSAEWANVTKRVKKEAQKIAKELLQLYAKRHAAKGFSYKDKDVLMGEFEETFPYEETPGQIKAILDVKKDMLDPKPMDRLVCGDVGFGKTEVAMRAAFLSFLNGKQVAFMSPITILADQHFKSFKKRMDAFNVRLEMLSRFKTKAEQTKILKKVERGEVDILIGTHRLLQPDIKFKNLGLVIIDEEQRFGVKQKETMKEMRNEVDILTLTATPIPRTLNICLNKLREITTITTAPPGRLPVITEVRKYSERLVEEAIMKEIDRGGQVYLLHNRVQTIDSLAAKLSERMPNVRFIVAHGQLNPLDLEKRIMEFTEGKYDVLVSSTIVENGIDLPNANTLIVNSAEKFGLSQLYQLRGRVGRGKAQAYAYLMYHGQRLKLDAKKRLKAIVEASELGSGFQIAMKDLEIRGAGEILGSSQSGAMNVVGVTHFLRMLNKAVKDLEAGKTSEDDDIKEVSIELPINAYIPESYISASKDKINLYQKLSSADTHDYLMELRSEVEQDFGHLPAEVLNLFDIIELKMYAKKAHLVNIKAMNMGNQKLGKMVVLRFTKDLRPENIMNMLSKNPKWQIGSDTLKIPMKDLGVVFLSAIKDSVMALAEDVTPDDMVKKVSGK